MAALRTGVLGAGALGLTLAYRLAQGGDDVTVIEREPEPGGLAAGFQVAREPGGAPVYLEKFYHHLFRADRAATGLIEELGLADRLVWPHPVSAILRDGQIHRLGPVDLLRLTPLPFVDRLRMGAVMAYLKLEKGYQRLEGQTAEHWLRRWMGQNAYAVFAEPLLRQKFGAYADQIAMPWFWSRLHLRSTSLGYLTGGFQHLYTRLAERLLAHGGTLRLGTTVTGIAPTADGIQVTTDGGSRHFDRVVSTLPAALTFKLTPALPREFRERYRPGAAYGAHCLILELDRPLTGVYWIAINDPGYPFLAVVEHTNYMPPEQYEGKHLVYVGNYVPMDHPLMQQPADETLRDFAPYLRRIAPAFEPSWVQRLHAFAAPYAQPIVTTNFRAHIAPHDTPIANLYLANMFQIYPQDRGQNYSIAMAERLARRLQQAGVAPARPVAAV
ncbi:MAG TPA: NAD(P)/FAD-dependent oxidoreductase [Chloroflexota bacterium]|nr:NAD(P)/FAD-dependent oxidoreductase [Chloroflexota bacterium]